MAPDDPDDPAAILRLLHAGDERGLDRLFECYAPRVKGLMAKRFDLPVSDDLLDDAIQDALHKTWKRRRQIVSHPGAYFGEVAIRRAKKLLSKRGPRPEARSDLLEFHGAAESGDPPGEDDPRLAELLRRIDGLPPKELEVLRADRVGHLPSRQLAEELGTTPATIDSTRHRTRRRLVGWLRDLGFGDFSSFRRSRP